MFTNMQYVVVVAAAVAADTVVQREFRAHFQPF